MSALSYEERLRIIKPFLFEFYAGFEAPKDWTTEKLSKDISETAELVNSEVVADVNEGYLNYLLDEMGKGVKKSSKSRRLPAPGILIDVLTKIKACKAPDDLVSVTSLDMSKEGVEARRLRRGECISEHVVFGEMGRRLVETQAVEPHVLEQCQQSFILEAQRVYGPERGLQVLKNRFPEHNW